MSGTEGSPGYTLNRLTLYSVTQSQRDNNLFLHQVLLFLNLDFHEEQGNTVCVGAECLEFLQALSFFKKFLYLACLAGNSSSTWSQQPNTLWSHHLLWVGRDWLVLLMRKYFCCPALTLVYNNMMTKYLLSLWYNMHGTVPSISCSGWWGAHQWFTTTLRIAVWWLIGTYLTWPTATSKTWFPTIISFPPSTPAT